MKILFVCSGNAHRSPLAEALLRKMRPDLQVDSAGLHVAIPISEEAKEYLTRQNAEQCLKKAPESLEEKTLHEYDLIVAMEQRHKNAVLIRCPECKSKTIVWSIEDPYSMLREEAEKIYEQIREKVSELARTM